MRITEILTYIFVGVLLIYILLLPLVFNAIGSYLSSKRLNKEYSTSDGDKSKLKERQARIKKDFEFNNNFRLKGQLKLETPLAPFDKVWMEHSKAIAIFSPLKVIGVEVHGEVVMKVLTGPLEYHELDIFVSSAQIRLISEINSTDGLPHSLTGEEMKFYGQEKDHIIAIFKIFECEQINRMQSEISFSYWDKHSFSLIFIVVI
jgi:hypothetical protein